LAESNDSVRPVGRSSDKRGGFSLLGRRTSTEASDLGSSSGGSGENWKAWYSTDGNKSPALPAPSSRRKGQESVYRAGEGANSEVKSEVGQRRKAWRDQIEKKGGFRFHSEKNVLDAAKNESGHSHKGRERRKSQGSSEAIELIQMYRRASEVGKQNVVRGSPGDTHDRSSPSPTDEQELREYRNKYKANFRSDSFNNKTSSRGSISETDSPVLFPNFRKQANSNRSTRATEVQPPDFASMRRTTFMNSSLMKQLAGQQRSSPSRSAYRSGNVSPIGNEGRANAAISGSFRVHLRVPHNATGDSHNTQNTHGTSVHSPHRVPRNDADVPMLPFLLGRMSCDMEGSFPRSPPRSACLAPWVATARAAEKPGGRGASDTQDSNLSDVIDSLAPGSRGVRLENRLLKLVDQTTVMKEGSKHADPTREYRSPAIKRLSKIQARVTNRLTSKESWMSDDSVSGPSFYKKRFGMATNKFQATMKNLRPQRANSAPSQPTQDEGEKVVKAYIHWKVLIRSVFVITLAIIDVIMALVQLFWGVDDLYCSHEMDKDFMTVMGTEPRQQVVWTMTVLFISYTFNLFLNLSEAKAQGGFQILRYRTTAIRTTKKSGKLWALQQNIMYWGTIGQELQLYMLELFILVFSFIICWMQYWLCFQFDTFLRARTDYTFVVVNRIQLVVHFLRSFTLLQRCLDLKSDLRKRLQSAVSMNKRRFVDSGNKLDLDLTYVCDRMIAMAMPCVEGAVYRNDIKEVARFFATRHYGSFLVFNLCEHHEENGNGNYDTRLLYGQVQKLPFRDHNAPPFHWLGRYCEQASAWLDMQSSSLVAVHCQGGKGRTGTFCSALLLWTGACITSKEALTYFKERRTDEKHSKSKVPMEVSSPSQKRYVEYVEMMLVSDLDYRSPALKVLRTISLWTLPFTHKDGVELTFFIECEGKIVYEHSKIKDLINLSYLDPSSSSGLQRGASLIIDVGHLALKGDVSIRFFYFERRQEPVIMRIGKDKGEDSIKVHDGARSIKVRGALGKHLCFVTFHTSFHDGKMISFARKQIDGAHDQPQRFSDDFKMILDFLDDGKNSKPDHMQEMRNNELVKKKLVARARRAIAGHDEGLVLEEVVQGLPSKGADAAEADVTLRSAGPSQVCLSDADADEANSDGKPVGSREPSSAPSGGPSESAGRDEAQDSQGDAKSPLGKNDSSIGSLQAFRSNKGLFPHVGSDSWAQQSSSLILHIGEATSEAKAGDSAPGDGSPTGAADAQKIAAPEPRRNTQGKLQSGEHLPESLSNSRGARRDTKAKQEMKSWLGKDLSEQEDGETVECLQLGSGRRNGSSDPEDSGGESKLCFRTVSSDRKGSSDDESSILNSRTKGASGDPSDQSNRKLSRSKSVGSINEDHEYLSHAPRRSDSRRKSSHTLSSRRRGCDTSTPDKVALKHVASMTRFLKELSIGQRQIELRDSIKKLMKRECSLQLEFNQGDVIYAPESEEDVGHSLYYLQSGSATWESLKGEPSMFFINVDTCSHGMYESEGDFYGTLDMITPRAGYSGSVLRAWTKKVVVKVLRVDKAWEYHLPLRFQGMDDWEVFLLMQKLAYETNEKCVDLSLRLERLAKQANAKHGRNIELDLVAKKEVYNQLQNRFKIQPSDELWDMAEVQRLSMSNATLASGQACIFSNWLIFISSENKHDRLVPLSHIQDVRQEGDVCVVQYTDIDSDYMLALAKQQMENPMRTNSSLFAQFRRQEQQQQQQQGTFVSRVASSVATLMKGASSRQQPTGILSQNMKEKTKSKSASSNDLDADTGLVCMRLRFMDAVDKRNFKNSLHRKRADISRVMGVQSKMRQTTNTSEVLRAELKDFGYILPGDDDEEEEEDILSRLFSGAEVIKYKENDTIVFFGDTAKKLYHIVTGYVNVMNAKGALMYKLGPGDIFGSSSFLELGNRGFENHVQSLTSVELRVISLEDVERLTVSSPLTGARIYRNICISLAIRLQLDLLSMRAWQQS